MRNRLLLIVLSFFAFQACAPTTTTKVSIDDKRFENEILIFEDQDNEYGVEPDKILFIGSSSIRMWKNLGEDMKPFDVLNRGFGGATTPEINKYFDRVVKPYAPKYMIVYVGENDIAEGATPTEVLKNVSTLFEKTKALSKDCKIIYLSMKPSIARWEMWADYKKGNAKVKKMMEANEDFYYLETADVMLNKDGSIRKDIFIEDGLHMNEKGYKEWTKLVKPVLEGFFK